MEAELAVVDIELPPTIDELITEDGEPLESEWHRAQINLLIDSLRHGWRAEPDFFAGGNMFVYYSLKQIRNRDYRSPDFFVVLDVDGSYPRKAWGAWEEEGRYPDVIVELLSPTTAESDLTTKKRLYEQVFNTTDYFCYNPDTTELQGWTLRSGEHNGRQQYVALTPNERGWLWSRRLGLWLGLWEGVYLNMPAAWVRFFKPDGSPILTEAETERQRTEAERQRAEQAQIEIERPRARLRELGVDPDALT